MLVLETRGTVEDFISAVRRIQGMEWMGEVELEDLAPDEDFYDQERRGRPITGRLFLVSSNRTGLDQLLSLWRRFTENPDAPFDYGLGRWKRVFEQLHDVRFWGVQDRLLETNVLTDWQERVDAGEERIRFEAEFWFTENSVKRENAVTHLRQLLEEDGGELITQCEIIPIRYHAALGEIPTGSAQAVLNNPNTRLIRCDEVMFFRPSGQADIVLEEGEGTRPEGDREYGPLPTGDPVVALLDGLPLANHQRLDGRLAIDDPDDWAADYPAEHRRHGTAMASLITHGELDANGPPISRPLYCRPILKPYLGSTLAHGVEQVPDDVLVVDFLHRVVRRIFDQEGDEAPAAPSVRVINLSIGDRWNLFHQSVSALARLLDWLSWHYQILIVVSAGNHLRDIVLDIPRQSLSNRTADEIETETVKGLASDIRHRRLRVPSEAMNVLTVGAVHADASPNDYQLGRRRDLFHTTHFPSPISALGLGYRRSIKPDLIVAGGRQLYRERPGNTGERPVFSTRPWVISPGQRVAVPSPVPGELDREQYACGTSNSTALVTRAATHLYDVIELLRRDTAGDQVLPEYDAVILKTLLVHSASWAESVSVLWNSLETPNNRQHFREIAARFLGYGEVNVERVLASTDQRATLLGCGTLSADEAHDYTVPLPPSLASQRTYRRLTITVGWLSPINPSNRKYRRAAIWFSRPGNLDLLGVHGRDVDWQAARRGTVQQQVYDGEVASTFVDGNSLNVQVNCRADAEPLDERVRYAIAVTIEVAEGVAIPIYEEIRERIRVPVPVVPATSH